jgi:hypothetical protein
MAAGKLTVITKGRPLEAGFMKTGHVIEKLLGGGGHVSLPFLLGCYAVWLL